MTTVPRVSGALRGPASIRRREERRRKTGRGCDRAAKCFFARGPDFGAGCAGNTAAKPQTELAPLFAWNELGRGWFLPLAPRLSAPGQSSPHSSHVDGLE